jgi:hypothetical protein
MPNQPTGPHNGHSKKFWTPHSISPADNSRVATKIGATSKSGGADLVRQKTGLDLFGAMSEGPDRNDPSVTISIEDPISAKVKAKLK